MAEEIRVAHSHRHLRNGGLLCNVWSRLLLQPYDYRVSLQVKLHSILRVKALDLLNAQNIQLIIAAMNPCRVAIMATRLNHALVRLRW